jgi:uncharacterized protein (TIGR03435 family)
MKRWLVLMIILSTAVAAYPQQFEVASIRINKDDSSGVEGKRISIQATPGGLTMRNVTLLTCIRWAYNVRDFQISGGPDWRDSERYDIIGRTAAASSDDQLRLMLRALLQDRFKLVAERDSRELPVYVLSVGKNGHRMQRSKTDAPRMVRPAGTGLALQNATMSDLEQFLSGIPALGRPVVDQTGLQGAFDFTLSLFDKELSAGDPGTAKATVAGLGASVYEDALERIGLKLESKKLPMEHITIQAAERPAAN